VKAAVVFERQCGMIDPDSLECSNTPMAYRDLMRMQGVAAMTDFEYAENCPSPQDALFLEARYVRP
jgi:hypothetical protein